ncbi:ZN609 protein, partial [Eurystomus gularis]|nr:ZN609 protein [Eurystomus gularis]
MSLSSGASGGKGIDANPVETYDSGDEWDIGVGNLIIDLDADLEKDQQKLEMSASKEVGLPAPNAVATLPDNIKFVSPVPGPQGKEGKSKSKRSKSAKDSGKPTPGTSLFAPGEAAGGKKEAQGRSGDGANSAGLLPPLAGVAIDTGAALNPLAAKAELDDGDGECRQLKKVKSEKMESPVSTPAVLPLHLLVPVVNNDISSPCEQIMVRTRSVGVNTCDVALATEPECLGPCEPGTSVNLEGIVWQETEDGMLVVNVTWRNKTYVGTLLDCTQHDWAFCDSPTSDLEMRNGRGRGKRVRPNSNTPVTETAAASDGKGAGTSSKTRAGANSKGRRGSQNSSEHRTPPGAAAEDVKASPSSVSKRKSKPLSDLELNSSSEDTKGSKRIRTNSMGSAAAPPAAGKAMPSSPQLKPIQPKPTVMGEPFAVNPALTPSKEKKKKDKKKKEPKEAENPLTPGKACRAEDGKSPFRGEAGELGAKGEGLLNGSSDPHQSRLASIKAEADKIYSFTDNANAGAGQAMTPLHVVTQNGAEAGSVKTNSPAYSDISDAGEDGEGKLESVKAKDAEQLVKEGAKKALFPPQPPSKESPYYQGFESYYSPGYPQASPGALNAGGQAAAETQALKLKKDEEQEGAEAKGKSEGCEEKKAELGGSGQQPSVIQQRPNVYMQSLYYNQYAYVPPYGYNEQGYHAHLLSTNPAYRQQYEEQQKQQQQQQRGLEKKPELGLKERELKEEWKQKPPMPPTLTKAPSLTDLVKSGLSKAKEQGGPDVAKSVIIPKLEDSAKLPGSQGTEGLKVKLSEASGHLGKETAEPKAGSECGRQAEVDPVLWYRQEAEPRMWTYVYPAKYSDIKTEDERWKEERDRKLKEERTRSKDGASKEDGKEGASSECKLPAAEEPRVVGKEPRPGVHVPVSSPLTQHQSYIPYMHGYSYGQSYDPNHPGYRAMPAVMMQNYPGSYLPSSYSFSPYGSKASGSEDGDKSRASPSVGCKSSSESKALDILQQHASHYKSKSPTISEKTSQERDRGGCGVV